MNFGFSKEQLAFKDSYRGFLENENPITLVKEIEEKEIDYSREIYRKMADLGWLQLMIPEKYYGIIGGDWVDMAMLYEEFGRVLLQSPYFTTVTLGAQTILSFGTEEQKHEFLPRIAKGEIIMALAMTEVDTGADLASLATTATADGENYIINGNKLYISYGHLADYMIMVTRTAPNSSDNGGITLFLIDGKNPNIACVPMKTLGLERRDRVVFDEVQVSKEDMLGEFSRGGAITNVVNNAKVMLCAEAMGGLKEPWRLR